MKKRVLSLLLVLVMAVGMLPVSAMAAEGEPAPAPVFQTNLKEPEVTYYSDSSIRALSIQITKDEASYTKDTLEIKWQSSNSGEEGSFSDAKDGVFNFLLSSSYKPDIQPGETKYYRAKVTNNGLGEGMTPTTVYSAVTKIVVLEEAAPIPAKLTFQPAAKLAGEEGNYTTEAAGDINAEVKNYWGGDEVTNISTGNVSNVSINSWDTVKYDFTGWLMQGQDGLQKLLSMHDSTEYLEVLKVADETAWAAYVSASDLVVQSYIYTGTPNTYALRFNTSVEILKDFSITPVFTEKAAPRHTLTLERAKHGTASYIREGESETYTLTAAADKNYLFARWEQSADNGSTWTPVESSTAKMQVTLAADTSYRAVFVPISIEEMSFASYYLPSSGDNWTVRLDVEMSANLQETTPFTVNVYEGSNSTGTLLETVQVDVYRGSAKRTIEVDLTKRPSSDTTPIYVTATLLGGEPVGASRTLCGTLDMEQTSLEVDCVAETFMKDSDYGYLQFSATCEPNAVITWSGGNDELGQPGQAGTAVIEADTGKVTFTRFYSNNSKTFYADAGDGRVGKIVVSFIRGKDVVKLGETALTVLAGETNEYAYKSTLPKLKEAQVKVTSSDESIFTAAVTTKEVPGMFFPEVVLDKVTITGVKAGTAELSIALTNGGVWTCPVTVTSSDIAVEGITVTPKTAELNVGGTTVLSAVTAPATAAVTVTYSSSKEDVARVNANTGVVTAIGAGEAVITATATDGSGKTVTDTCVVTVTDAAYTVKVYVPTAAGTAAFYPTTGFDTAGRDTFAEESAIAAASAVEGDYTVYTMSLEPGTYSFRGTSSGGQSMGGGCFAIPEADTAAGTRDVSIYLRQVEFSVTNSEITADDLTLTVKNTLGTVTLGAAGANASGQLNFSTLMYAKGGTMLYSVTATPNEDYMQSNHVGVLALTQSIEQGTDTQSVSMTLPAATALTLTVPSGAKAELAIASRYQGVAHVPVAAVGQPKTEAGKDTYSFLIGKGVYEYRVSGTDYVTYIGTTPVDSDTVAIEVTEAQLKPAGKTAATLDRDTKSNGGANVGDILMNNNTQGYLKLNANATYQLSPMRQWWGSNATWEMGGNYYILEPDFHYTVVGLDGQPNSSVITVDENGKISAVGAGTAIVLITYDAMTVNYHDGAKVSYDNYDPNGFFGAIWPENTGVLVVSVDAAASGIDTGLVINTDKTVSDKLDGVALDADYDVIYFMDEQGEYTFTPGAGVTAVSVANPTISDGKMSFTGFTALTAGQDGRYTVPLTEGRNIVKVDSAKGSEYQVITAKQVDVTVNGKPLEDAVLVPGEKVSIQFDTLYNPVNRMYAYNTSAAAVYFNVSGYEGKSAGNGRGGYGYYFFASNPYNQVVEHLVSAGKDDSGYGNSMVNVGDELTVPADFDGDVFTLSNGAFNVGGFSHYKFGEHRTKMGQSTSGMSANMLSYFGQLPDISIPVGGKLDSINVTTQPEMTEYCIGDVFDPAGMKVTATYQGSEGSFTKEIDGYTYDTVAFTEAGTKTITISYTHGGVTKTTSIQVTVKNATLEKIEVTTPPNKTAYSVGAAFDPTGMVVTATYSDGSTKAITGYTYSPETFSAGDKTVTITYGGKTAVVDVQLGLVTQIAITTPPAKTTYKAGEGFSPDGMVVTATYSDGSTVVTTDYNYTPSGKLAVGDSAVTITYTGSDADSTLQPVTQRITVTESSGGEVDPDYDSITVTISYSDKGEFVTGVDGTVLCNAPVTVYDKDQDGRYTMGDAFAALHEMYYSGGASGYEEIDTDGGGWVNKFWGNRSGNISYVLNHSWVNGPKTEIEGNDKLAVYAYKDLVQYSDLYTWFEEDSYNASVGTEKVFTVHGINVMNSSENRDSAATPVNAAVTVYDEDGRVVSAMATTTDENGQFVLTFASAGTYTVEISGTCDYTCEAYGGSSGTSYTDATVVPSRCEVVVSGGSGAPDGATGEDDKKAADKVAALIDAIGTVTKDSGKKIEAARKAYDALTGTQKKLVGNYSKLTAAEKEFAKLTGSLPFMDVQKHWALEAIKYAYTNDLMNGVSDTAFSPDSTLNRAMLATILYRLEGEPAVKGRNTYADVAADTWYTDAVIWASENGIVTGYGEGKFGPTDNITREQMAVMLYRYAEYKKYDTTVAGMSVKEYADYEAISEWALEAMAWANAEGLITGRTASTIVPSGTATRAEAATILMRFLESAAANK